MLIESSLPDIEIEIKHIKTQGDKILDRALSTIGSKGLFTKELELELLEGRIDIAVHSLKDLPTELPDGLHIASISKRHSANDVVIAREKNIGILDLPINAKVGTGSVRRKGQILSLRNDIHISDIRGNVNTRISQFLGSELDAIILAHAGVVRLGLDEYISSVIPFEQMLPAVGQGSLALETKIDNAFANNIASIVNDEITQNAVNAEREFLKALGGGCTTPIAAYAAISADMLSMEGMLCSEDGKKIARKKLQGLASESGNLGRELAQNLLAEFSKK